MEVVAFTPEELTRFPLLGIANCSCAYRLCHPNVLPMKAVEP